MKTKLFFLLILLAGMSQAQTTVAPYLNSNIQLLDNSGNPCAGCQLDTFAAGSTTPLVTYSESTGTSANSNPILLDSGGRATVYLTSASYKFRLRGSVASGGATIWTQDSITWSTPLSTFAGLIDTGDLTLQKSTAATSGANQSSNNMKVQGNYWTGAASAVDQWLWQDVLGTGSNPTSTFTLTHSGSSGAATFSVPGNVSVGGTFTATCPKNIAGIQYACNYVASSTTCGIAEAYAALPTGGGKIILQQGNCSAAGWPVTIQKPIVIEGQGMGGPNDPGTNANIVAGTSLTNTSTGGSFFVLSLGSANAVEGITFKDFAMIGNKIVGGATAGDCVDINGGTTAQQMRALKFENIQCNQPKGSGWVIQDNAFMISFYNVHTDQAGSHCYVVKNGPNSGIPSQIHFVGSTADLCGGNNASINPGTADGWNISGANSRTVDFTDSTMADSLNGINVVAGATGTQIHVTNADFETNTICDANLNDGYGHKIVGSTLLGTGVGARGVCTNMPGGANFVNVQLLLDGNNISSHVTQDVTIGATQHTCFILPQAQNNYTFSDASATCVVLNVDSNGTLNLTAGAGIQPTTNGAEPLGASNKAWSNIFEFANHVIEFSPTAAAGGQDVCYGDQTLHGLECNNNNSVFTPMGTRAILTADWTCGTSGTVASCTAATIIGSGGGVPWTFNLPLVANSLQLDCDGVVGQATAATSNQWNLLTATNGATNVTANYSMATAATASVYGAVTDQASTTTTFQIAPNWTLGGTATKMPFHIHASVEGASASGTVFSVQLLAPTVGDLVTIYRGSGCWIHP
jgi:hypothetical protein